MFYFHDGDPTTGNDSSVGMDFAFQLKYLGMVESHGILAGSH